MSVRTAFVFAGGGSLGAIQVGALRELVRAGVQPDFLVGASVGALNASYFAGSPDMKGVEALEAIWRGLKRQDIFPITLKGGLQWLRGGGSLIDPGGLRRVIERDLPFSSLEDARTPLHVVATGLDGAAVRLSSGPAVPAILASAAIPIAFPSVRIGENYLVDGAIAGNTPVLTAAELGATRIIVLQTGYACSMEGPPRGAIASGLHAITLLISNQMQRDLQLIAGRADVHITPHLCPLAVSPFDFSRSADLIERSARTTRDWLDAGGLDRPSSSRDLQHDHDAMMGTTLAAGGYDLVSYFPEGGSTPRQGSTDHRVDRDGATYVFVSEANRKRFEAAPGRYLPQYGGLCAWAMAGDSEVQGDPQHHQIVGDRLFFNLNHSVHQTWMKDAAGNIRRADRHWRHRRQGRNPDSAGKTPRS